MPNHEAFLKNHPNYVKVSREGGNTDVILAGQKEKSDMCFAGAVLLWLVGGYLCLQTSTWGDAARICRTRGHYHTCTDVENAINFGLNLLPFIAGVALLLLAIKLACTKTIIRIDELTGNFTIFTTTPWRGAEKRLKFSRVSALPRIARRPFKDEKGKISAAYRFEVYPSQEGAKKKAQAISQGRIPQDVFVADDWSRLRCDWVQRLILSIQDKPLPPEKTASEEQEELWTLAMNEEDFSDLDDGTSPPDDKNEQDDDDDGLEDGIIFEELDGQQRDEMRYLP